MWNPQCEAKVEHSDHQPIRVQQIARFQATYVGPGEFYTGIRNGERVLATFATQIYTHEGRICSSTSVSISKLHEESASLSIFDPTYLIDIDV